MPETETDSESLPLDAEDWKIAFEPYEGHSLDALTLGFHLTELKRQINDLQMREALASLDRAIDRLYEHSEFCGAGREMFLTAIAGNLTTDKEEHLRQLGIRI